MPFSEVPDDDLIEIQRIKLEPYKTVRFPHEVYTPALAAELYRIHVDHCAYEMAMALTIDRLGKMRSLVYTGYADDEEGVSIGKRAAVIPVLARTKRFVLLHNHVDNDMTPSRRDKHITRRVAELAAYLGKTLVDHLIVGNDYGWVSLRDKGWLPQQDKSVGSLLSSSS